MNPTEQTARTFQPGERVEVAKGAKTVSGGQVFADGFGTVQSEPGTEGNVPVLFDANGIRQWVAPKYVTPVSLESLEGGETYKVSSAPTFANVHPCQIIQPGEVVTLETSTPDFQGDVMARGREGIGYVAARHLSRVVAEEPAKEVVTEAPAEEAPETLTVAALTKAWKILNAETLDGLADDDDEVYDDALLKLHWDIARAIQQGI